MLLVLTSMPIVVGQQTAIKPEPGMYVDQNGTLLGLIPAAYSGTQSSNHVVKANIFWTFRGAHSVVQLSAHRPHFSLVCGQGNVALVMLCGPALQSGDLIFVQLDEKSDHREARMATGSMFGGHGGFDSKRITIATAAKRTDGNWDVSPDKELKSGEYLITTGVQPQGFDFGIKQ